MERREVKKVVSVRMSENLIESLDEIAKKEQRSRNYMINKILSDQLLNRCRK